MTIPDLIAQHASAMNALHETATAEIEKHGAKLREVIGDPYAAYRALKTEPATETKPPSEGQ